MRKIKATRTEGYQPTRIEKSLTPPSGGSSVDYRRVKLGPGPAIRAWNNAIERCARVAEKYHDDLGDADITDQIAAAIRALKDKPAIDPNLVYPGKDPDFVFPEET